MPTDHPAGNPYAGAQDLNAPGLTGETGVLFMEGEASQPTSTSSSGPRQTAKDMKAASVWLARAMEQSWGIAGAAALSRPLPTSSVERHRIIANDWQAAELQGLIARLLHRALDLRHSRPLARRSAFDPPLIAPHRLSLLRLELIDHATDLMAESAILVHDNERRGEYLPSESEGCWPSKAPQTAPSCSGLDDVHASRRREPR